MILLDGKATAKQLRSELAAEIGGIRQKLGRPPQSAIILVGNNPASEVYVRNKIKASEEIGIKTQLLRFDENISQEALLSEIQKLNSDPSIDGFIVQLPLPSHIDENLIIESIDPAKDIDGFHPVNIGKMTLGLPSFIPATPLGILELIKKYNIPTEGKHVVVVGRSNIVGTPVSILLGRKGYPGNATVTLCHSKTNNLKEITLQADILIASIGKPHFITADMVKQGVVVIDVGINRIKSDKTKSGWKLVGDVDFDQVSKKASYITPVPGGVGPMTITALLKNTVLAAKSKI